MKSLAVLLLLEAVSVHAFWRMQCGSPLVTDRIDPLVQPGVSPGKHVHNIMGGSAFSKITSFSILQESTCTSCEVKGDKSIYWVPTLYFEHEGTGEFEQVRQKDGMLVYYIPEYGGSTVEIFPEGFAMVAGDPTLRTFDDSDTTTEAYRRQMAIGFNCLNYAGTPEPFAYHRSMPDKDAIKNCKDGLRADITFPSCWDGNLDSDNHRDHMAYPSGIEDGTCPDTHQRRLITMKFETLFDVSEFFDLPGRFVWSTGDLTGYGYHGDFVNGWNTGLLQAAYDDATCNYPARDPTGAGGVIETCNAFSGQLQDIGTMNDCKIDSITGEEYAGPFNKLPGCNPVDGTGSSFECGVQSAVQSVVSEIIYPATTSTPVPTTISTTTKPKPTTTPKVEIQPSAIVENAVDNKTTSSTTPPAPTTTAKPVIEVASVSDKKVKEVVVTVVETVFHTVYHDVVETATTYIPHAARHRRHRRRVW
ncbi:hypothetical protein ABW19_dt0206341 [Dactylella cylindrospora]|nr:hypothetical protein ABW19_dt0206341 [Dactylella cylindrospora]